MEDIGIVLVVLVALLGFYVLFHLWRTFFCKGDSCEEYTEYSDNLDNGEPETFIPEDEK